MVAVAVGIDLNTSCGIDIIFLVFAEILVGIELETGSIVEITCSGFANFSTYRTTGIGYTVVIDGHTVV